MTVNAIESGTGAVWQVKQAALGTIEPSTSAGTKQLRLVGDSALKANKVYGSEEFVDGQAFGSPGQYVDTLGGDVGSVTFQAQIETAGFAFAQIIGVDVVTGTTPDFTHTITTSTVQGPYQTFRQKVGSSVGPVRQSFYDAKITKLTWNCGQDQKVAHIQEDVMALKAGSWFTTDPTATDSGTDSFNWNEGTGAIDINGTKFAEVDGETLEIDRKLDVHRGDSASPACFIYGKGEINRTFSALVTDNTIPVIQNVLYGTTSPADGAAVTTSVVTNSMETLYTRNATRSLKITTPKVVMKPDDFEIGPRAEGGKIPVTFGGMCLISGGTHVTIVAKTGDSAVYV